MSTYRLKLQKLLLFAALLLPSQTIAAYDGVVDPNDPTHWIDRFPDGQWYDSNMVPHGVASVSRDLNGRNIKTITLNSPLSPTYSGYSWQSGIYFTLSSYGCLFRVSGSVAFYPYEENSYLSVESYSTTGDFDYYIDGRYNNLGLSLLGSPPQSVSVTIKVYYADNVDSEEVLRLFVEHGTEHTLYLTNDITLSGPITIRDGQDFTINLNGHTIRRNLSSANASGNVFVVEQGGKLTIDDTSYEHKGMITGGWTTGNGGAILNNGTLDVVYANITGNKADNGTGGAIYNTNICTVGDGYIQENSAKEGGGIYNASNATLTISDAVSVYYNRSSSLGGGVANYGTATMSAGYVVSNNAVTLGGGIYNSGTITLSGGTVTTNHASKSGGGIYNQGSLAISDGEISLNTSPDGGGIYNAAGLGSTPTVLNITGGSIKDNEATTYGGGGVTNYGTMLMSGGSIEKNRCVKNGAGIWVGGDAGTLTMYGSPVVRDNNDGDNKDLFLNTGKRIKLSSSFRDGAYVSVSCDEGCSVPITEGNYLEKNPRKTPEAYIHYSSDKYGLIIYNNEIARLPYVTTQYVEEDGDVITDVKCLDISELADNNGVSFGLGYNDATGCFLMKASKTFNKRITVVGNATVILADGTTWTANGGIGVPEESDFSVYRQTKTGTAGKLVAKAVNYSSVAAIGGGKRCGAIGIYGVDVTATGNYQGAGIGGDVGGVPSSIIISNATVTATGGVGAAGIGTGQGADIWQYSTQDGQTHQKIDASPWLYDVNITISNSTVDATGGTGGAGIGGGQGCFFLGTVTINGGKVTATGGTTSQEYSGAGIGSGASGSCYLFRYPQAEPMERYATININGGEVYANGGFYAAGIGGGTQTLENPDLSDIGTYEGDFGELYHGGGANVVITAGFVRAMVAKEGWQNYSGGAEAIGHGGTKGSFSNKPTSGSLWVYDEARVQYPNTDGEIYAFFDERVYRLRSYAVIVEACTHEGNDEGGAYLIDGTSHSSCKYCLTKEKIVEHQFGDYGECACGIIGLFNSQDNTANIRHWHEVRGENTPSVVVLTGRKLYRNGAWNTLCLPFELDETKLKKDLAPDKLMTLKNTSFNEASGELTINFEDAAKVRNGIPYIIKWEKKEGVDEELTNPMFKNVILKPDCYTVLKPSDWLAIKGTFDPIVYDADDTSVLFLGSGNSLYYPQSGAKIGAFRSYFKLDDTIHAGDPEAAEPDWVRAFVLNFGDEEQQTGMESLTPSRKQEVSGYYHSLDGRRFDGQPTKPGIYLVGGRKVVVR